MREKIITLWANRARKLLIRRKRDFHFMREPTECIVGS